MRQTFKMLLNESFCVQKRCSNTRPTVSHYVTTCTYTFQGVLRHSRIALTAWSEVMESVTRHEILLLGMPGTGNTEGWRVIWTVIGLTQPKCDALWFYLIKTDFLFCLVFWQSVWRLTTGWTVRGSNPGVRKIIRTRPDRPWGPPSLLYKVCLSVTTI